MSLFLKLAQKYPTPHAVQKFISSLTYNSEKNGETLRSAKSALQNGTAHCLEASFIAAAILEYHNHPPLILSMESTDLLDHVVYLFKSKNCWGAVGRSREVGLQGRAPVFKTIYDLVDSYFDPFIDRVGRIRAYDVFHLDECSANWRYDTKNLWRIEQFIGLSKHTPFKLPKTRYKKMHKNFLNHGYLLQGDHWW